MVNKNSFYLLLLIVLSNCHSSKNISKTNNAEQENNVLLQPPKFSLDFNKEPKANIIVEDSGYLVLPQLIEIGNCNEPLTEITFAKALILIEKETTHIDKMDLCKKIVSNNCLTTFQIKRMGGFFTSELNKLQLFQFSFPYCYDQQNFFKLENEFVLENNKTKFKNILK